MDVFLSDTQNVPGSATTLFQIIQQGPVNAQMILRRAANAVTDPVITYYLEEWNGSAWVLLGTNGSDYYNTLSYATPMRHINVESNYPKVRMTGFCASGTNTLDYSVTRSYDRPSGGVVPIISF
jgi:hypothetical protein